MLVMLSASSCMVVEKFGTPFRNCPQFAISFNWSSSSSPSSKRGGQTSTRATMMLVIVVGMFLVVEVPLSVLLLFVIIENTFNVDLFSDTTRHT